MRAALFATALAMMALPAMSADPAPAINVPGLTLGFSIPQPPAIVFEALEIADLDRAVASYTPALGMQVVGGTAREVFVGFDTEALSAKVLLAWLKTGPVPRGRGAGMRLIISVPDLTGTLTRVGAFGGEVTRQPAPGPGAVAFVSDPDGYAIELTQPQSSG